MTAKPSFPPVDEQLAILRRTVEEIIPEDELARKLERSRSSGTPLVVKCGYDPTRSDLHLGHTVTLRKLRDFQELGHDVTFLIGDFTALIGDPSGRSATRPALTREEIEANAATFRDQVFRVLDSDRTTIRYNSEWLGKFGFEEVLRLASRYTVARMLERDDFRKRYEGGAPIAVHEFLYPLMQGFDSVAMKADVELGGTDQKFNLLVARDIQREYGQDPQVIVTMPLLEGTDGVQKMSKSLDNAIGLTETPEEMFGKTMSIPDSLIGKYFRLAVGVPDEELEEVERGLRDGTNPRDLKRRLARRIVALYHDEAAAERAEAHFDRLFVRHELPEEIPEVTVAVEGDGVPLARLLREAGLVGSTSEGRRLVEQGGVSLDERRITDPAYLVPAGSTVVIQAGKRRFARVRLQS
jgi:tyrosyl-tRNA synthetase